MATTSEKRTMTLDDYLATYAASRVWWTSVGSPTGQQLALNEDEDAGEDYCDGQTLLEFIPSGSGHLDGTVTRSSEGEWRWEVDSLQDEDIRDFRRNTILNLVVWGTEG